MCGSVTYPVAALKSAPEPKLAAEFVDFLQTGAAAGRFEDAGFTALAKA